MLYGVNHALRDRPRARPHLPLFVRAGYCYVPGSLWLVSQVANWRGVRTPSSITAV